MWCENREEARTAETRGRMLGIRMDGPEEPTRCLEALVRVLELHPRARAGDLQGQGRAGSREAGEPCCEGLGQVGSPWRGSCHRKGSLEAGLCT